MRVIMQTRAKDETEFVSGGCILLVESLDLLKEAVRLIPRPAMVDSALSSASDVLPATTTLSSKIILNPNLIQLASDSIRFGSRISSDGQDFERRMKPVITSGMESHLSVVDEALLMQDVTETTIDSGFSVVQDLTDTVTDSSSKFHDITQFIAEKGKKHVFPIVSRGNKIEEVVMISYKAYKLVLDGIDYIKGYEKSLSYEDWRISPNIQYFFNRESFVPEEFHEDEGLSRFICPITKKPVMFPVMIFDQRGMVMDPVIYEREALRMWLKNKSVSPLNQDQAVAIDQIHECGALGRSIERRIAELRRQKNLQEQVV